MTSEVFNVGKIFIDVGGAGRLYVPKKIVQAMKLEHKESVRLKACGRVLEVCSLRRL